MNHDSFYEATDMQCPERLNVESVAELLKEGIIILLTAEATIFGVVEVTWKIPKLAL